jgi:hypothetical protein
MILFGRSAYLLGLNLLLFLYEYPTHLYHSIPTHTPPPSQSRPSPPALILHYNSRNDRAVASAINSLLCQFFRIT